MESSSVTEREAEFWDEHVPELDDLLARVAAGPDTNTRVMLDALEPLSGRRVLDFACGSGFPSVWLAQRGAQVTGADISPASIARARELAAACGVPAEFVAADVAELPAEAFDRLMGRYALHHTDIPVMSRILRDRLRIGGIGAFNETMALNPLLRFARARLMWVPGVKRFGSDDEHPLTAEDLRVLRDTFGELELSVGEMKFLRILDRNLANGALPALTKATGAIDDALMRHG